MSKTKPILLVTKSVVATYETCRRLHQIEYVDGYRPVATDDYAAFGTLFHAGLEAWWTMYRDFGKGIVGSDVPLAAARDAMTAIDTGADEVARVKADLLMMAYHARWAPTMDELEVLAVEAEFIAPIPGLYSIRIAGKIDAIVRKRVDGHVWNVEHKTSGADLRAGSTYWQRLRMDPQVSQYTRGARVLGHEIAGTIYDVVVRSDKRPHKATPLHMRKYTKAGVLYANQRAEDETMDDFRVRIADDIIAEPEAYFARMEVVRLDTEMSAFDADLRDVAIEIRDSVRTRRAPRNPHACFTYGRTCAFYDVCTGLATLDDTARFTRSERVHSELSEELQAKTRNPKEGQSHGDTSSSETTGTGTATAAEDHRDDKQQALFR